MSKKYDFIDSVLSETGSKALQNGGEELNQQILQSNGNFEEIENINFRLQEQKLDYSFKCMISILIFGVFVFLILGNLNKKRGFPTSKMFALSLIVISSILLIVLGYTEQQMSPVIGLLGTVAGYILGSKDWSQGSDNDNVDKPKEGNQSNSNDDVEIEK